MLRSEIREKSCAGFSRKNIRRGTNAQGPSSRRIPHGYLVVRDYAPVPMVSFPWQVSGLRDVRGGSNP